MFRSEKNRNPENPEGILLEKKRKLFYQFARKYPEAIKLYEEYGLLPKNGGWNNVAHHCLVEAMTADVFCDLLKLSEENRKSITTAAFLHDFYKRYSIKSMDNSPKGKALADIKSAEEGLGILEQKGIEPKVIEILNNSLGYPSIKDSADEKMNILEKIMHYLDDITKESDLVPLSERMTYLKGRYEEINKDQDLKDLFGYKHDTYDQQEFIGKKIQAEFAELVGCENPEKLPIFLKEKINEKINNVELI